MTGPVRPRGCWRRGRRACRRRSGPTAGWRSRSRISPSANRTGAACSTAPRSRPGLPGAASPGTGRPPRTRPGSSLRPVPLVPAHVVVRLAVVARGAGEEQPELEVLGGGARPGRGGQRGPQPVGQQRQHLVDEREPSGGRAPRRRRVCRPGGRSAAAPRPWPPAPAGARARVGGLVGRRQLDADRGGVPAGSWWSRHRGHQLGVGHRQLGQVGVADAEQPDVLDLPAADVPAPPAGGRGSGSASSWMPIAMYSGRPCGPGIQHTVYCGRSGFTPRRTG